MPIVEWDDAFSVGIEKIDEQHKKFFSIINRVYDTIQVVQNRRIGSILKDLQEYVMHHFLTEESWMKNIRLSESRRFTNCNMKRRREQ